MISNNYNIYPSIDKNYRNYFQSHHIYLNPRTDIP